MSLGGELRVDSKPVDVVFLVDVSGSMAADGKIQSLNTAVEEALPFLRESVDDQVGIEPHVRVLTFGTDAAWVDGGPQPLRDFWWPTLSAKKGALTELGAALALVTEDLDERDHELPPPLILLTDGMPTDRIQPDYETALRALDEHRVGGATSRVAVAIGRDADQDTIESFVSATSGQLLTAQNPQQLASQIRLAGTTVLKSASEPIW